VEPATPSDPSSPWSNHSGLSPSIEILTTDETTEVMSIEEAGAQIELARLGPYELGECIGRGGMAVVYKAKVVGPFGFEKQLVVKRLQPALTSKPEFFELFTQEARITAQLGHPGIVQVHDFGITDGAPFLVMEFLDGVNLAQVVKRLNGERMPIDVAVVVVTQVCHALGYAHTFRDPSGVRRQVVHGDVSPSNIMVCRDGTAKLLDFGVARLLGEFDFEMPPILTGKAAYMAPEQLRREPFDRRVDVFAAGIVLHELLTGRRLFAAKNDVETLHRVLEAKVERASKWNPAVPPALDRVVLRALAADPGLRFESADEMGRALEAACRVAGGRRRVAEYLERLFSNPGESEPSDGTLLTSLEESAPELPPPLPPPPLPNLSRSAEPAIPPVAEPFPSRPRSVTEMVRPLPKPQRRRPVISLALVSALAGFAFALSLPWMLKRVHRPRAPARAEAPLPRRVPVRRLSYRPLRPMVVVAQAPSPEPTFAPVVVAVSMPARPIRKTQRKKASAAPPARAIPAPAETAPLEVEAPPEPQPRVPRVKDGRLLDPFGAAQ
jgi:serine/threonine-protein kinase